MADKFPISDRPNESAAIIFAEHCWLQGAFLGAVGYGIQFILYVMTNFFLWKFRDKENNKQNLFLIFYTSVIFTLSTLYTAAVLQFTQESFIDGRNIDGGPNAFEQVMYSLPIDMLGNVTMVLNSWLCDIINLWRCFVIYHGCSVPSWAINIIPIMLYLGSIAFGIVFLKQVGTVSQSPWESSGINFTIPYYTMSLALNILVTILIVSRLLFYRHRIVQAVGKGQGSQYTSMAAMIVESAAIYSSFSLLFLIPFALNSPISQLFLQPLSMVQCVSTFLIIFRVATGKGWSRSKHANLTLTGAANRTISGGPMPGFRTSTYKRGPISSNNLSSCENGMLSQEPDEPIILDQMASPNGWRSPRKPHAPIEISKHVLVEEDRDSA